MFLGFKAPKTLCNLPRPSWNCHRASWSRQKLSGLSSKGPSGQPYGLTLAPFYIALAPKWNVSACLPQRFRRCLEGTPCAGAHEGIPGPICSGPWAYTPGAPRSGGVLTRCPVIPWGVPKDTRGVTRVEGTNKPEDTEAIIDF